MVNYGIKIFLSLIIIGVIYYFKDRRDFQSFFMQGVLANPNTIIKKVFILTVLIQLIAFVMHVFAMYLRPTLNKIDVFFILLSPSFVIFSFVYLIIRQEFTASLLSLGFGRLAIYRKGLAIGAAVLAIIFLYYQPLLNLKSLLMLPIVLVTVAEELWFRGILWSVFTQKLNIYMASLASATCWSLVHIDAPWPYHVTIIFAGLFLSWSFYKSRTILVPIALHLSVNIIAFLKNV